MVAGRGSVRGCWQGRHVWLLVRGYVWLLGGVRGCWGAGMVACRGHVWLLVGACMSAGGGCVWLLVAGMCGCCQGGIHGC